MILFERRGELVGYRVTGALTGATTVDPPGWKEALIHCMANWKRFLWVRVCIGTKPTPWLRPGRTPGSKKAVG